MSDLSDFMARNDRIGASPSVPRPIVVIGAGSIVRDAHLPVYARLGFPVAGIFDVRPDAAKQLAAAFQLPRVFATLGEAVAHDGAVFDIAVPPGEIAGIVERLPRGTAVLIQKPLGRNLTEALRIRQICRDRALVAAVNFQLRHAPNMAALRNAHEILLFGELTDVEVRLNLHTPWDYWPFLKGAPRLEILMHSIHYIDMIRSLIGDPRGVHCHAVGHPALPDYADTRTSIILDYGPHLRCSLTMNHTHDYGARFAMSQMKVEGTIAAAIAKMGVNLNYPDGEPDDLWVFEHDIDRRGEWEQVPLRGSWFLEGFEGPMAHLQAYAAGETSSLWSNIDDAVRTMAVVEACYASSAGGGTPVPDTKPR
jgi:predicted dehydrogenase